MPKTWEADRMSGLRGRGDTRHMQSRSGPRTSLWQLPSTCFCHLSTVPGSVPSPARHMHPVPTRPKTLTDTMWMPWYHSSPASPYTGRAGQGTFSRTPNTFQFVHFSNGSETPSTSGQPRSHAGPEAAYSQSHRDLREGGFSGLMA